MQLQIDCFRAAVVPLARIVDDERDDERDLVDLLKADFLGLGLKVFLDEAFLEGCEGILGPSRGEHADLFCVLFFRSPTVSRSGSAQETSNMVKGYS